MSRRKMRLLFLLCLAFGVSLPAAAQRTKIVAYTAIENEQLPVFKAAIESAVPEVEVEWRHYRAISGGKSAAQS
jgi:iron(III) transport system substrate-binding protein